MNKRIINLFLVAILILGCISVAVFAEEPSIYTDIDAGDTIDVNITSDGQYKYFRFISDETNVYTIKSNGNEDTCCYLYDSYGNQIGYNDDGNIDANFALSCNLYAGNVYYFGVKFYSSSKTGSFSVSVSPFDYENVDPYITNNMETLFEGVTYTISASCFDGYTATMYFYPLEDGFYSFNGECISEWGYLPIPTLKINDDFESPGDEGLYKEMCYLKAGTECSIQISMATEPINYEDIFSILISKMTNEQAFIPGEQFTLTGDGNTYYKFIPEKSGDFIFSIGLFDTFIVVDVEENKYYSKYWSDTALQIKVKEGNTYYIVAPDEDVSINSGFLDVADSSTVYATDKNQLSSNHYYENNLDKQYIYTGKQDTVYIVFKFSDKTCFASRDYLYIYDKEGTQIGKYSGTQLKNKSFTLIGNTFSLKFVTDSNEVDYGFEVSELTEYNEIPKPTANVESGTIRPSSVTLSASEETDIFYKIETGVNQGEFQKYTGDITIDKDCKLYAYTMMGQLRSETVCYEYIINNAPIPTPVISLSSQSGTTTYLSITAEEGEIYYKRALYEASYRKCMSETISVYEKDTVFAYAQSGNQKSEIVSYSCEPSDDGEYTISSPIITKTPIMGGYDVMVSLPDGVALFDRYEQNNYGYSHMITECGTEEWYTHTYEPWSRKSETQSLCLRYAGENSELNSTVYANASNIPQKLSFYENAALCTEIYYDLSYEYGYWTGENEYGPIMHELIGADSISDSQSSSKEYIYINILKAEKPVISVNGSKIAITSQEGTQSYYCINGGEYLSYSAPFTVEIGDSVTAYSIGMGISKSDVAEFTYTDASNYKITGKAGFKIIDNKVENLEIIIHNNTLSTVKATVMAAIYDEDTNAFLGIAVKDVDIKSGENVIDDLVIENITNGNCYIKAFLWKDCKTLNPLDNSYTISQIR